MNDPKPLHQIEELFSFVPPEVPAVNAEWAAILDWDTTPKDLRSKEVKTLKGFCEKNDTTPARVNRIRQEETYLRARRQMAQDRGMLNHQCFQILEALYEQALAGNVPAIKEWNRIYPDEMAATASKSAMKPATLASDPTARPEDLDTEEIERILNEMG